MSSYTGAANNKIWSVFGPLSILMLVTYNKQYSHMLLCAKLVQKAIKKATYPTKHTHTVKKMFNNENKSNI